MGIFTKQLLEYGINTIGIEPNIETYNQATKYLDEYNSTLINSSAEDTSLSNNSIDLITVAQALHWFHLKKLITESKIILKDSGRVAVIYNNFSLNNALLDLLSTSIIFKPDYANLYKRMNNHN